MHCVHECKRINPIGLNSWFASIIVWFVRAFECSWEREKWDHFRSLWITYCYIVEWLGRCGILSLDPLVSLGSFRKELWILVPHCLMSTIWRERNGRTFEDVENHVEKIIELFMGSLYDWSHAWCFSSSHSLRDFLESLTLSFLPNPV